MAPLKKIRELEKYLKYEFKKRKYQNRALTHSTFTNEQKQKRKTSKKFPDQEIYSTFGDAILKTIFIDLLMERGLSTKEEITKQKEALESNDNLAEVGKRLKLIENKLIKFGKGAKNQVDQGGERFLADTVEAIVAAIFIDTGYSYNKTKKCIKRLFKSDLDKLKKGT